MSQAMMFRDNVDLRTILQALGPLIEIQDAQRDPESSAALLRRLDEDAAEDVRAILQLLMAGINRDGYLVFIKSRKQDAKGAPIWINLAVPPPDRFRIVPYDPPAISELLAEQIDAP